MKAIALGLLSAAVASAAPDRGPDLEVRTDRPTYRFGEPVWLYVRVRNPLDDMLAVENPHCSRTRTRIEISDGLGRTYPMTGPASCATTILERIPPGDEMLYAFELLEFYGIDGSQEYPFGILPPGPYRVRYRSHEHLSPEAEFEVETLKESDQGVFHAYVEVLGSVRASRLRQAAEDFRAFADANPRSVFAPALLCRSGVINDLFFDSERARADFQRLIREYPNSGFVSVAIRHLAFGMGQDREPGIAFLREIPRSFPGTVAADFARRVIARIDDDPEENVGARG
jgi:hypothetical protein